MREREGAVEGVKGWVGAGACGSAICVGCVMSCDVGCVMSCRKQRVHSRLSVRWPMLHGDN
jgi:hypothetical protein